MKACVELMHMFYSMRQVNGCIQLLLRSCVTETNFYNILQGTPARHCIPRTSHAYHGSHSMAEVHRSKLQGEHQAQG